MTNSELGPSSPLDRPGLGCGCGGSWPGSAGCARETEPCQPLPGCTTRCSPLKFYNTYVKSAVLLCTGRALKSCISRKDHLLLQRHGNGFWQIKT